MAGIQPYAGRSSKPSPKARKTLINGNATTEHHRAPVCPFLGDHPGARGAVDCIGHEQAAVLWIILQ
jgi:hypothetical protein